MSNFNTRKPELTFIAMICALICSILQVNAQAPLKLGQAVTTSFNGTGQPVVYILDVHNTATATPGTNWSTVPRYTHNPGTGSPNRWTTQNLGPVFGITFDKGGNIYVAATSSFYQQGGTAPGPGGSGGIYKIDATTFAITSLMQTVNSPTSYSPGTNKIANTSSGSNIGPSLGNITYNPYNDLLYVTNFEDGMIYRIKTDGTIMSRFDPKFGVSTSTADIASGFAPLGQRPFAVAIYGATGDKLRLYYSNWGEDVSHPNAGLNEIYSVALDANGDFIPSTEQLEVTNIPAIYPAPNPAFTSPISDIEFSNTGRMLVGERAMNGDYQLGAHFARAMEFTGSTGAWAMEPISKFLVGGTVNANTGINCAGGVDYSFRSFKDKPEYCDSMVWASGDYLKFASNNYVYGIEGINAMGGNVNNSILVDMNGIVNAPDKYKLGDVDVWKDYTTCTTTTPPPVTCAEMGKEPTVDTNCCQLTFPFSSSAGIGPVVSITGSIVGGSANGTFESITIAGCSSGTPSGTIFGSTTAGYSFSPACSPTGLVVEVAPNNSSGTVEIEWTVVHKNGSVCKYKTKFKCRRKPLGVCDKFSVIPSISTSTDYDIRRFKITNLKEPQSPICKIRVKVVNFTGGTVFTHTSGDISFDAQAQNANSNNIFFPSGSGSGYNLIPAAIVTPDNLPGLGFNTSYNHSVNFNVNLNLNQYGGMNSYVQITAIHCDGDSCTYSYGPWKPSLSGLAGDWGKVGTKKISKPLYAASFTVKVDDTLFTSPLKWLAITIDDTSSEIFAISGAHLAADPKTEIQIVDARQSKTMALFELPDDLRLPRGVMKGEFNMVFTNSRPRIRFDLIDAAGKKVISDTITVPKTDITTLKKHEDPSPFDIQLSPNPAQNFVNVAYTLPATDYVSLQITNGSGQVLDQVGNQLRTAGNHSEMLNTSHLPAGAYYLQFISTKKGTATVPFIIVR